MLGRRSVSVLGSFAKIEPRQKVAYSLIVLACAERTKADIARGASGAGRAAGFKNFLVMNSSNPCPLWVKSRHLQSKKACPLYPQ
jgi:hypothetical protein